MFCPECRSEYRPGFTRCADCDVALIDDLSQAESAPAPAAAPPHAPPEPMLEFCGFFTLEEAREARDLLRRERVRADVLIREPPGTDLASPVQEEFWLRVGRSGMTAAAAILGYDEHAAGSEDGAADPEPCPACGHAVPGDESFCPGCGLQLGRR